MTDTIRFPSGFLKAADVNPSTLEHFCNFHAAAIPYLLQNNRIYIDATCICLSIQRIVLIAGAYDHQFTHPTIRHFIPAATNPTSRHRSLQISLVATPSLPTLKTIRNKCRKTEKKFTLCLKIREKISQFDDAGKLIFRDSY
ncbi:hypothetical protein HELRODRAFT_165082 [Helobdella robusta]|uniref:Uncharacterized protein n=1 Tax=Helobdella robusta TaxID=6412 RepID=T1EW97_HELRO|nr:hypothetical protein HELRODRAFT_165082 [Helobdella robusta]ESN92942.1 hypothetical protein HELRODRAFT_165082 [Helobdella robusta]